MTDSFSSHCGPITGLETFSCHYVSVTDCAPYTPMKHLTFYIVALFDEEAIL